LGAAVAFGSSAPPEEERKPKQKAETHPATNKRNLSHKHSFSASLHLPPRTIQPSGKLEASQVTKTKRKDTSRETTNPREQVCASGVFTMDLVAVLPC